ncbi:MAG TPA: hypothetical protein VEF04_13095 [Blastocatellia bacterium]|nr:hypothetical protein [Blastocatellia bacterium]
MFQYLLGELPPAWQAQFEERFFSDQECFEQLKLVEDRLVDDYVSHALSAEQRKRFESHYLNSDRRREKLKFAQTLKQALTELKSTTETRSTSSSWQSLKMAWQIPLVRYSGAGLAIIVLIISGWLIKSALKVQNQLSEEGRTASANASQPSRQATAPEFTPQTSPALPPSPSPKLPETASQANATLAIVLSPGTLRDDQATARTLSVSPRTKLIHLKLTLKDTENFSAYRVTIETASGQKVLTQSGLHSVKTGNDNFIVLEIPVRTLPANDYLITVSGRQNNNPYEEVDDYQFRIVKRQ